jgi:hypothetical protein
MRADEKALINSTQTTFDRAVWRASTTNPTARRRTGTARAAPINIKKESDMNDEATKPRNLRANAVPADGYVLSIDGKLKARYETESEATAAGAKLKQSFPVIQISVFDAVARTYAPVELQEK